MKKIIIAGLIVLNVWLGISVSKEIPDLLATQKMNAEYDSTTTQIDDCKKRIKNISNENIEKSIAKQNLDLNVSKNKITDQINQGLDLSYNHSHNEKEIENVKKKLPKLVGKSFSDAILANDVGTTTQNGLIYPLSKLDQSQIAFGDYDLNTGNMPFQVNVQYQNNLGKSTTSAYGIYYGTYNAKTNEITNVKYSPMTSAEKAKAGDE